MSLFSEHKREVPKLNKLVRKKTSKIMLCRCSKTHKDFCIRLDRNINESVWHMAYAFPFHPCMRDENFTNSDKETLTIVDRTMDFHGCPYCGNSVMNFCSCGGIFCADGEGTGKRTCPVCGESDVYGYHGNDFSVKSSSY